MKVMWCWRCQQDFPMLDEAEHSEVWNLFLKCSEALIRDRKDNKVPLSDALTKKHYQAVSSWYEQRTGIAGCHYKMILHHRISKYGPPCHKCGKPLRTPKAKLCAACGERVNSLDVHSQPPVAVTIAIRCIWASLMITVLGWVLLLLGIWSVPEDVASGAGTLGWSVNTFALINIAALLLRAGIIYFIVSKLTKGRTWARIVCLIAASTEVLHDIYHSFSHFGHDNTAIIATSFTSTVLHCILYGYAMYLLFTSPGKEWFKQGPSAP